MGARKKKRRMASYWWKLDFWEEFRKTESRGSQQTQQFTQPFAQRAPRRGLRQLHGSISSLWCGGDTALGSFPSRCGSSPPRPRLQKLYRSACKCRLLTPGKLPRKLLHRNWESEEAGALLDCTPGLKGNPGQPLQIRAGWLSGKIAAPQAVLRTEDTDTQSCWLSTF